MKDKVRVVNHPVHPMLIPFPIGLWVFSLAADIIYRLGGNANWATVAYYSLAGGIIGAIVAAVPGFLDYLALKPSRTKKIALWHMLINVGALALFTLDFFLRRGAPEAVLPFVISIVGVLFISVSGWLGGHMVYVLGVAVDESTVCLPYEGGTEAHAHGMR